MSQLQHHLWQRKKFILIALLFGLLIAIEGSFNGNNVLTPQPAFGAELSYTTLAPADMVTHKGTTGGNQPVENLHVWDQNGSDTDWDRFVQFKATDELYVGHRSYIVPSHVDISSFTKLFVHPNYRGPSPRQQVWTWYVHNWTTGEWDRLGYNDGADWSAWKEFFFTAPNDPADYINNSSREIRIYVESNNTSGYMQLDFEAVILESYDDTSSSGDTTTVTYRPTTDLFPNPERGFTRAGFASISTNPTVWDVRFLNHADGVDAEDDNFFNAHEDAINTQVDCYFVLDKYFVHNPEERNVYIPIEASFLQNIEQNLDKVRRAGKKCILRFAYADPMMYPHVEGEEQHAMINRVIAGTLRSEPDLPDILAHLDQLRPIFNQNSDVISVVETGLIGVWGEWHYTSHFLDDPALHDNVSAYQQGRRNQVAEKLLDVLPPTRMITMRRPFHKRPLLGGRTAPVEDYEAFSNTSLARIGYHNDAFINVNGDMGTYANQADRDYVSLETRYLPMGGETNWIPENANVDRSCGNTISEMETFHWSYIAGGYHERTIHGWLNNNCIHNQNNIQGSIIDRLGYRFRLIKGVYPNKATVGGQLSIRLDLVNEGFAAPYNARNVFLILKNRSTGEKSYIYLPVDPRFWLAGQQRVIETTVDMPSDISPGQYELALILPDIHPNLIGDSRYAIRFANAGLWPRPNVGDDWPGTVWADREHLSEGLWAEGLWDGSNNLLHTVTVTN